MRPFSADPQENWDCTAAERWSHDPNFIFPKELGLEYVPMANFTFRIDYLHFALHIYLLHSRRRIDRSIPNQLQSRIERSKSPI